MLKIIAKKIKSLFIKSNKDITELPEENFKINFSFDDYLKQRTRLTPEEIDQGKRIEFFEQFKPWSLKYGYKFNVYKDHLIDGEKHFHFDNSEANIFCKVSFDGTILETKKNSIPANVHKDLKKFLSKEKNIISLNELWDKKNKN